MVFQGLLLLADVALELLLVRLRLDGLVVRSRKLLGRALLNRVWLKTVHVVRICGTTTWYYLARMILSASGCWIDVFWCSLGSDE